jgi:hypothetical protein
MLQLRHAFPAICSSSVQGAPGVCSVLLSTAIHHTTQREDYSLLSSGGKRNLLCAITRQASSYHRNCSNWKVLS